jgi:hypothetical protein
MRFSTCCLVAAIASLGCWASAVAALLAPDGIPMQEPSRLVRSFTPFAGSEANLRSLLAGLEAGQMVTLRGPHRRGAARGATTFRPPRPMEHGAALVSLALARALLAGYGLMRPSPSEIEAALMGGRIVARGATPGPVQLPGVLRMRAQGMRWEQITGAMRERLT